uniref:Uncharacterized protein n=1 Tax=Latimeria chalumnae TaxID=7897 RepID=H3B8G4_LATCH
MSQLRIVQLASASLALVLCKEEENLTPANLGKVSAKTGCEIFGEFQTVNAQCFWNKRLARSVCEVSFQGWLENCVLLVQGKGCSLEVLREAWMRRALKAPKGFSIRAVGE